MVAREELAARVAEAALLEGDFVLSSGKRSSFYVDKYLFSTRPALLGDIAAALVDSLGDDVDRLAGVELGAVPLVVAASLQSGIPFVISRKGTKEYGTARSVEGELHPGEKVVLMEDVVTTGSQAVAAAEALEESGAEVVKILAVLDRREGESGGRLGRFDFESLLEIEDLGVVKRN